MKNIGFIKVPLLRENSFALIPYDKAEKELLSDDEFLVLLDMRIKGKLAELTSEAMKEEKC